MLDWLKSPILLIPIAGKNAEQQKYSFIAYEDTK